MFLKKRILSLLLLVCALAPSFSATVGCGGGRDELGNRYKSKTEGKDAATAEIDRALELTEQISDINYAISLMTHSDIGSTYDLGYKNEYCITGRKTDDCDIYCTKTYYGTTGTEPAAYYLNDGYIYVDFCNTMLRAPADEQSFYDYVRSEAMTASTEFFDRKYYGDGAVYRYSDGTSAAVLTDGSEELGKLIADHIGVTAEGYAYDIEGMTLRYEIGADGIFKRCELSFKLEYYKVLEKNNTVTYDGSFGFEIKGVGGEVTVKKPQAGVEYSTVSELSMLPLLTGCYEKLISLTDVAVRIERTVENSDYSGSDYKLTFNGNFTQSYRDGVYEYGSIDHESSKIKKAGEDEVTSESSVGMFVDPNGIFHYRELDRSKYQDGEEKQSAAEWLEYFAGTVSTEAFWSEELCCVSVSEDGEFVTFNFSLTSDAVETYAKYLLATFSDDETNVKINNVYARINSGTVKVRVSDGCLIEHSMEFRATVGGSIYVSGSYKLKVTATGDDVTVLDTDDWEMSLSK